MNAIINYEELEKARRDAIAAYENANVFNPQAIRESLKPLLDVTGNAEIGDSVNVVRCKDCQNGRKKFLYNDEEVVECQLYHHEDKRQYKPLMHFCADGKQRPRQIKPCPFCGCKYKLEEDDTVFSGDHEDWCPLGEKGGFAGNVVVPDTPKYIGAWNRRSHKHVCKC